MHPSACSCLTHLCVRVVDKSSSCCTARGKAALGASCQLLFAKCTKPIYIRACGDSAMDVHPQSSKYKRSSIAFKNAQCNGASLATLRKLSLYSEQDIALLLRWKVLHHHACHSCVFTADVHVKRPLRGLHQVSCYFRVMTQNRPRPLISCGRSNASRDGSVSSQGPRTHCMP